MSSLKDLASLIMIPSLVKDGRLDTVKPLGNGIIHPDATGNNDGTDGSTPSEGNFTFSRGSNLAATRVDVNGLIEKGRENLLLQSNQFDTTWNLDGSTITGGQTGYDGSNNAWLFSKTSPFDGLNQAGLSQSGISTTSIYAKIPSSENDVNALLFRIQDSSGDSVVTFNLTNDTIPNLAGNAVAADKVNVGNGWYRCSLSVNATISRVNFRPAIGTSTGASTGTLLFQDSQLEQGLVATDYIETGASTAQSGILEDLPRLDYSGGASCPALLLEPQRTNQCSQSEYIGSSDWNPAGITRSLVITQTSETNPEGGSICWKIQGTASDNQLGNNSSTTSGTTITNSIYIKRVSGTGDVFLRNVNNNHTSFSLSVADGWKRIDVTGTATSATARFYLNLVDFNDEILVWGAQQEAGSYPTSYIPTYGSAVTRSADDVNELTSATSLIGQSEGTLFLDFVANDEDSFQIVYQVRTTGSTNVGQIDFRIQSGNLRALGNDGGANQFNISAGAVVAGTRYKCAVRYANNDVAFYVNGVLKGSDASASFSSSSLDQIGFNENTGSFLPSVSISQSLVFPTALTDSECIALTTI